MNAAIVRKTLRDAMPLLVLLVPAAILFEIALVFMVSAYADQITDVWRSLSFARELIGAMVGDDLLESTTPTGLMSIGMAHPILYALCWILLLTNCTRVTVGEIDRGTADLLLTLPVSRSTLYISVSAVWLLCAALISAAPWCGIWLGSRLAALEEPIRLAPMGLVAVNLVVLNVAIGALAMMVSSFLSRRGLAVGIALGLVLVSFLLGFLAQAWPAAEGFGFLGLLHYYQPLPIVRSGVIPAHALLVLGAVAVVSWTVGLWQFRRRDIPAV